MIVEPDSEELRESMTGLSEHSLCSYGRIVFRFKDERAAPASRPNRPQFRRR